MIIDLFLKTAAAPAAVIAILIFLFGHAPEPWRARVQSFILMAGFVGACYLLAGFPPWPPQGGATAMVYAACWFAVYSWVVPRGSFIRLLFRGIWVVIGALIACWSLAGQIVSQPAMARDFLLMAALGWSMWFVMERSTKHSHVLTGLVISVVSLTAASFLFLFKSSLLMSQMMTSLSVLAGGVCVIAWLFPARLSLHGLFPFFSGFLGVALVAGMFFLDIEPLLCAAVGIPFAVLFVKNLLHWKSSSPLTDAIVTAAVGSLPLGYILFEVYKTSGPLY